jgi:hypothetical protein
MATAKKRPAKRKAPAARAKKGTGQTIKITVGGVKKTYKRELCGAKSNLDTKAASIRAAGGTARVLKNSAGSYCLYKGPRKAKPKR